MRIGVIVDSHGKNILPAIEEFEKEKVDIILANGDFSSLPDFTSSREEFLDAIDIFSNKCNKDVLIIPGNHERRSVYTRAIRNVCKEFPHIKDMFKLGELEFEDVAVISYYGGIIHPTCVPAHDAFLVDPIEDTVYFPEIFHAHRDKKIIFQTHYPAKGYCDRAYVFSDGRIVAPAEAVIKRVGDKAKPYCKIIEAGSIDLAELIEGVYGNPKPTLVTSGDIHKNYKYAPSGLEIETKKPVEQGERVSNLAMSPGPYLDGRIGICELGEKVSYKIINLEI